MNIRSEGVSVGLLGVNGGGLESLVETLRSLFPELGASAELDHTTQTEAHGEVMLVVRGCSLGRYMAAVRAIQAFAAHERWSLVLPAERALLCLWVAGGPTHTLRTRGCLQVDGRPVDGLNWVPHRWECCLVVREDWAAANPALLESFEREMLSEGLGPTLVVEVDTMRVLLIAEHPSKAWAAWLEAHPGAYDVPAALVVPPLWAERAELESGFYQGVQELLDATTRAQADLERLQRPRHAQAVLAATRLVVAALAGCSDIARPPLLNALLDLVFQGDVLRVLHGVSAEMSTVLVGGAVLFLAWSREGTVSERVACIPLIGCIEQRSAWRKLCHGHLVAAARDVELPDVSRVLADQLAERFVLG